MSSSVYINDVKYPKNKVRYIRCNCWEKFTAKVTKTMSLKIDEHNSEADSGAIYRGHALKQWKLSSRLERAFDVKGKFTDQYGNPTNPNFKKTAKAWYEGVSKSILTKFVGFCEGMDGIDLNKDENELWALGRHHGLITPILDWTESPYIAAFFAFAELNKSLEFKMVPEKPLYWEKGNVYIWGLRRWRKLQDENEFKILTLPRPFGSRLWAQAGLFTRLISNDYINVESYLKRKGLAHYLECYIIPRKCAATVLIDLKLMNITFSTLFPDLYGAAQEANLSELHLRAAQMQSEIFKKEENK